MLIYDCTDPATKANITNWINQISQHLDPAYTCTVLVCNKVDLGEDREVSEEEGKQHALDHELKYFEVSAKTGQNIEEVF